VKNKRKIVLKTFLVFVIATLFIFPGATIGALSINTAEEKLELVSHEYVNDNELLVSLNLKDLLIDQIEMENGLFTTFNIPNNGFSGVYGKPQLPVISCLFAVPTEELSLTVINANIDETYSDCMVYPAQLPQVDSDVEEKSEFFIDEDFYQQDINYPENLADLVYTGKIRDISFIKFEFSPIQYNPKEKIASVYDEITVRLSWNGNNIVSVESGFNNVPFYSFYNNVFPNWEGFLKHTQIIESPVDSKSGYDDEGCDFLIITHPDFYTKSSELRDWKYSKGLMTKIVDTDEIGDSSNEIKQYIKNAYDTWDPRPSYVLLVGDYEYVTTSQSSTDLYYVTVEGSDYYPDIYIGRIPADSADEANVMISKILNYEQNPPASTDFYENFAVAAYFQDDENNGYETRRFVRTSEEVRDYLMSIGSIGERIYVTESYINPTHYNNGPYGNGEPLPEELLRPTFPWDGDSNDITNAIENGVFILNHRDHGFVEGWGDPYYDVDHVHQLTNGELLPVVFSLNCQSGQFDGYECFCEEFVRQEGGGAVAAYGASRTSYSGYNDYLCRGFYDCQWPEFDPEAGGDVPMYKLGQILNYGKTYMAETWGDPWGYEKITFEMFHVFGDPTMEIWTEIPKEFDLNFMFTGDVLEITITHEDAPVEGALVCLSQDSGYYFKGYTDESGLIGVDTTNAIIENPVTLVISAHNFRYFIDTFILNQPPQIPGKPEGPQTGVVHREITFSISTVDPEEDQVYYQWSWGNGHSSEWLGPYDSGETVTTTYKWNKEGTYFVKVKAKDIYEQETDWSEPLKLKVAVSRTLNSRIQNLFELLFKLFPIPRILSVI
jgi:hypothetical protein